MNREIKFRAWDKQHEISRVISIQKCGMIYFDFESYRNDQDSEYGNQDIDVKNMPIMQFTGLKDSKGADIYEGDIVKSIKYNSTMKVIWGYCAWGLEKNEGISAPNFQQFGLEDLEVIGNIYENPELLSQK